MISTPIRRNKKEMLLNQSDEDIVKTRKSFRLSYKQRLRLKQLLLVTLCVLILYLVYKLLSSVHPISEVPPAQQKEVLEWRYKNNPQGMTQESLKQMIKDIQAGKLLENNLSEINDSMVNNDISPLDHPYKSTGSLTFKKRQFFLEGKPFRILSGAMHYFRVMPDYWEANMRKMKACGLNTLETYVAWNLHEKQPGQFTFDGLLNLRRYIQLAQKVGLFVLLRPGPYICSEWDLGGLPAWLLRDRKMKVRTNYPGYQQAVERYLKEVFQQVNDLQHVNGGPIIGVQIENELASYADDVPHLKYLKQVFLNNGVKEMLFTSDGPFQQPNSLKFAEEALPTINFKDYRKSANGISRIKQLSPDFPVVVMEFWSGWFDHWDSVHVPASASAMARNLQRILISGASVNFYMFHGGTNFGFMSGANGGTGYKPDVTSYDYVAPLSEAGDITPKYELIREMLMKYEPSIRALPELPTNTAKGDYGEVLIDQYLPLNDLLAQVKYLEIHEPVSVENLQLYEDCGQNHGFTLYRAYVPRSSTLKFTQPITDRAQVLLNGIEVGLLTWYSKYWTIQLQDSKQADDNILDILVENQGRINYGHFLDDQRKGINSSVLLDDKPIYNWKVMPLEFSQQYLETIWQSKKWKLFAHWVGPSALYRGILDLKHSPADTFLRLPKWTKGVVFINGFNIGRYWKAGPQQTLYVPAPLLHVGKNSIMIFELHKGSHAVMFEGVPQLS